MGFFQTRILEWVAISSSHGSSQPWDQTCISCVSSIAGRFCTHWAIKETLVNPSGKAMDHYSYNIQKKIADRLRPKYRKQNFRLLKWYVGQYLYCIKSAERFLKLSTKTQTIKEKMDKFNRFKLRTSVYSKTPKNSNKLRGYCDT